MIEKIHIQNFKSLYDVEITLGRVNLFIGENGSGKSNFLEALVFLSAGTSDKLDNEFLVSRGLRVPEPALMKSAFEKDSKTRDIDISIVTNKQEKDFVFNYDATSDYPQWKISFGHQTNQKVRLKFRGLTGPQELPNLQKMFPVLEPLQDLIRFLDTNSFINFFIYSPENTALRTFEKEGQILPLGINGEGLLKLLKVVNNYEDKSYITTIIESLKLFNWFEDITIPAKETIENHVIIKDKYLYREIDQRSANEGFLFILFYITLIVAKETPKAFAIDNIDASLNPKLCTKLMTIIADLAQKYDKQIFLTTHNPAILDGINLNDEEQKLFVVSRNKSGHTRIKEITAKDKPKSSNDEPLHLSEAFMRGYLGGLPKGF